MCNLPFLTPDPVPDKDWQPESILPPDCNRCGNGADGLLPSDHKVQPLRCHA
jgi:hypothetical protein